MDTLVRYLFTLLLGLSIFLISLRLISRSAQRLFGAKASHLLVRSGSRPLQGVITGCVATALVQSSSAVAVTMVALVNAGVLTLTQAFGIILGANIGTTITAQIVSLEINHLALPAIFSGLFLVLCRPTSTAGRLLVGFGGVFFGLDMMKSVLSYLLAKQWAVNLVVGASANYWSGIAAGIGLTAAVQSSSAVTSLVIVLGRSQQISLSGAVAVALGSNIGTVVTTLISSIGLNKHARATAFADLIFNVIGVLLVVPFFSGFVSLVEQTSPVLARQIANAHTLFNVITALAAIPFIPILVRIAKIWAGIAEET